MEGSRHGEILVSKLGGRNSNIVVLHSGNKLVVLIQYKIPQRDISAAEAR
jgi:hypothetical protein